MHHDTSFVLAAYTRMCLCYVSILGLMSQSHCHGRVFRQLAGLTEVWFAGSFKCSGAMVSAASAAAIWHGHADHLHPPAG